MEPEDLQTCVEGMKTIDRVIESKEFSKFEWVADLMALSASLIIDNRERHDDDSTSLERYCRDLVLTIWHFHGGCQVGRVVDDEKKVLGVDALRVIDGSTFIFSPGTNSQATVMKLGRRRTFSPQLILNLPGPVHGRFSSGFNWNVISVGTRELRYKTRG
ncbi:hypothetical protein C4D60_Mb05t14550 [Musa balbisiana]|uniref:Glucose-methanol-choline oxidoreductase C-terminal domain-containing protein n=1 Tax=Musa balbisiana TaxID=52838 RepID=A0A4S8JW50_MUSBA|nr:hypothetical protein C4D60_Mb05t14550 [Musa balbisiana]